MANDFYENIILGRFVFQAPMGLNYVATRVERKTKVDVAADPLGEQARKPKLITFK
jgi:hypothetical protein